MAIFFKFCFNKNNRRYRGKNMEIRHNQNSVNFKAYMPVNVIVDGMPTTDLRVTKKAIVGLMHILKEPKTKQELTLRDKFGTFVPDFKIFSLEELEHGPAVRRFFDGRGTLLDYLLTGSHAREVEEAAIKIGPASKNWVSRCKAVNEYFAKLKDIISNKNNRLEGSVVPGYTENGIYPLNLNIYASSNGKPGKKGFKVFVQGIVFRGYDVPPFKKSVPVNSEKPPVISNSSKVVRGRFKTKKTQQETQQAVFNFEAQA